MLSRLLQIGVDFNALDAERRVKASLRFATSPEIPAVGERVLLADVEGNSCLATVESVSGLAILASPDWSTWIPSSVAQLNKTFSSPVFVEDDRSPPTSTRGEHLSALQPA